MDHLWEMSDIVAPIEGEPAEERGPYKKAA
jgi:hypothetical protein